MCGNDKCGAVWGTKPPGCVMIRHPDMGLQEGFEGYRFVKKDHNLENL
jgi:hypothetical protein